MLRQLSTWPCLEIKMQGSSFFGRVEKLKYLGTTLKKQNSVQEEIIFVNEISCTCARDLVGNCILYSLL